MPLAEACSDLERLCEWRKGRGREGEWQALGLAPLVEACSSLDELREPEERGENGRRQGLRC